MRGQYLEGDVQKEKFMKFKKVFTYSSFERAKSRIMGAETVFGLFLLSFPLLPMILAVISAAIINIPNGVYTGLMAVGTILLTFALLLMELRWIMELLTVYAIGEDGEVYRLRISTFWYEVKNCTNLLNPTGISGPGGRIYRMLNMVSNIRVALEKSSDISFDELVAMGKLERITAIKNVESHNKYIIIQGVMFKNDSQKEKRIKVRKVYDHIEQFKEYCETYSRQGKKAAGKLELRSKKPSKEALEAMVTRKKSALRFVVIWTGIVLWLSLFTAYSDINKIGRVHWGDFEKVVATSVDQDESGETKVSFAYGDDTYQIEVENKELDKTDEGYEIELYIKKDHPTTFFYSYELGSVCKSVLIIYFSVLLLYLFLKSTKYMFKKKTEE